MLKWLTKPVYNRFDPFWITFGVLAINDREWFACVVIYVLGAIISAVLEEFAKHYP